MKINNKKIIRISFSLAALLASQVSFANGTEAGTSVANTATLSYSIGGAAQSDINSDTATFVVDKKVDLLVSGDSASNILVSPSSTANVLTYTLKNEGNSDQDFEVSLSHLSGTDDNFDAGTTTVVTPLTVTPCTYTITTAATTTAAASLTTTGPVTLGNEEEAIIKVSCDMPNDDAVLEDGHISTIDVLATAVSAPNTPMVESAIDTAGVDVVLADDIGSATDAAIGADGGNRNASHSAIQTYEIDAPELTALKTSEVTWDPINLGTNPKRIPGAIVEYTITITNGSDKQADDVTVRDVLTAITEATGVGGTNYNDVAATGQVQFLDITDEAGGTGVFHVTADTAATPQWVDNTVLVTGVDVPANDSVTVKFRVTIE